MARKLRKHERDLIQDLLVNTGEGGRILQNIDNYFVEDEDDGGMGSLKFVIGKTAKRQYGRSLCQKEYLDDDGVIISVAFNLDQEDEPYELDIWKVDFSKVKKYPRST